jgi:hypothetical protein
MLLSDTPKHSPDETIHILLLVIFEEDNNNQQHYEHQKQYHIRLKILAQNGVLVLQGLAPIVAIFPFCGVIGWDWTANSHLVC